MRVAVNPNLVEMEYAVRGPIPMRAAELEAAGQKTIACNIGNPQALGQRPISFYRQVLSLLEDPSRIARERRLRGAGVAEDELVSEYVLELAERMLRGFKVGLGAYTESKGPLFIREAVARYIDARDGEGTVPSDPNAVFLTNGASEGVMFVLEILLHEPHDGVMIPIPQYPLYSAAIRRCGGTQVDYHPDEEHGWALERPILEESLASARKRGVNVKAIVVINPGNPTGAVLAEHSVHEVVDFAEEHGLLIIADEVYQHNTYGAAFVSFAKAVGKREVGLFSLHSASKGFYGECGHRGGYLEVRNPPAVEGTNLSFTDVLLKRASVSLCPNTVGQSMIYLMAAEPKPGSPPYEQFLAECGAILSALQAKALMIKEAFTHMRGVECFGHIGAMYLFPRLNGLPEGTTDFDYCMALLEETGLCTVNGSGFHQRPGTSHLRIAFLPPRGLLAEVLPRWIEFHNGYVK
ncbi:MAG: aminotransferase class I/II-fold pyridoxal phosphate-dependent enzyme [bacterium]